MKDDAVRSMQRLAMGALQSGQHHHVMILKDTQLNLNSILRSQTSIGDDKIMSRGEETPDDTISMLGTMCSRAITPEVSRKMCKLPESVTPKQQMLWVFEKSLFSLAACDDVRPHVMLEYLTK
jgi:hypothetical protein